jgi:hypothetical protein
MRSVRISVIEHGIERCRQRLERYNSRKHGAVANFRVDDERRALGDLEPMKFRS